MRRHIAAGVLAALCVGLAVGVVNVQVASAQPLTSAVTGLPTSSPMRSSMQRRHGSM